MNVNSKRAICPKCGIELVQVLLVFGETVVYSWLCDCEHVEAEIRDAIVEARNRSGEAVALVAFGLDDEDLM